MFRIIISTLIIAISALPVVGQGASPELQEKAKTAFDLVVNESLRRKMAADTGRTFADQIARVMTAKGAELPEEDRRDFLDRFEIAFLSRMDRPEFAEAFAKDLTERELDLMIKLYSDNEMVALMGKIATLFERALPQTSALGLDATQKVVAAMKAAGRLKGL